MSDEMEIGGEEALLAKLPTTNPICCPRCSAEIKPIAETRFFELGYRTRTYKCTKCDAYATVTISDAEIDQCIFPTEVLWRVKLQSLIEEDVFRNAKDTKKP